MSNKRKLVILGGATGVGKTGISIKLAKKINASIISADSMQVFKGFNIGSAKITPDEMQGVDHYLIDICNADQEFNVFEFKRAALDSIDEIEANGKIPMIVGGTGFYIQSVLYDIQFDDNPPDDSYRQSLWQIAEQNGAEFLHNKLKEIDPEAAQSIPANNIKRTIRAMEFYHESGIKISEHNKEQKSRQSPFNYMYFVMNRPREILYDRINQRVDNMINAGLESETRGLIESGISLDFQPMKGIGYKEMAEYINGKITLEDAISRMKTETRHYAKRQITWFKREKDAFWVDMELFSDEDAVSDFLVKVLKENNIV